MGESSSEVGRRFGENLRRARKRAGISQEALGERASLHRTEVGLLERGARVPRIDTLVKLASALGIRFQCPLLGGIEWAPGATTTTPGAFAFPTLAERHAKAMELAAAVRAGQAEQVDAAALTREAREELEGRGPPDDPGAE